MSNHRDYRPPLKSHRFYRYVHLRIFGGCRSFVSACTLNWCYDSGLWDADRSDKIEYVTCKKCLARNRSWERDQMSHTNFTPSVAE